MATKKSVDIILGQQRLTIRTDADPAHIQRTADLVNAKLQEMTPPGQLLTPQIMLIAAMNIADELIRLKESDRKFRDKVRAKSENILSKLDQEFNL